MTTPQDNTPPAPPSGDDAGHPAMHELEQIAQGGSVSEASLLHAAECERCQATIREIEANNTFLSNMIAAARSAGSTPGSDASLAAVPGIPGYELLGELHRGGQGVVFRARQIATKREVAIKLPLAGSFLTAKAKARFEREIELVAQMRHPNIVTVHDSGLTPDGRYFIVMELIDGVPLDRFLSAGAEPSTQTGRRRVSFVLGLFARVAEAIQHAHARGVIHRDIKPGNVLVDAKGQPHVLDFGLARRGEWSPENSPTLVDEFQGTPAYASPEQVSGDPRAIDVRTDIYSLGVMLYRSLTGQWPYAVDGSLSDQIRNIKHALPQAPSRRVRFVDPEVDAIVLTALAKEPQRRYQTAAALQADIEAYLAGRPIAARRASVWYVARKAMARRKGVTVAAASMLIAAGAWGWGWRTSQLASVRVAEAQAQAETAAADLSQRLLSRIASASGGVMQQGFARRVLDASAADLDAGLATDRPLTHAALRRELGRMYSQLDQHSAALHQFQAALAALELWPAALSEEKALVRMLMVNEQRLLGRFNDAADTAREAIASAARGSAQGQTQTLQAHARLLDAAIRSGSAASSDTVRVTAAAARADLEAFKLASVDARASLLGTLAELSLAQDDQSQATRDADRALALVRTSPEAGPAAAIDAAAVLARVLGSQGRVRDALMTMREQAIAFAGQAPGWASEALVAAGEGIPESEPDAKAAPLIVQHADDIAGAMRAIDAGDPAKTGPLLVACAQSATKLGLGERAAMLASAGAGVIAKVGGQGDPARVQALRLASLGWAKAGIADRELTTLREAVAASDLMVRPDVDLQLDLLTRLAKRGEELGDPSAGLVAVTRAATLAGESGRELSAIKLLFERVKMLERSGRLGEACEELRWCLWLARHQSQRQVEAELQVGLARLLAMRDHEGESIAPLIAGEAIIVSMPGLDPIMKHALAVGRAAVIAPLGGRDEAIALLEEAITGASQTLGRNSTIVRRAIELGVQISESRGDSAAASLWRSRLPSGS